MHGKSKGEHMGGMTHPGGLHVVIAHGVALDHPGPEGAPEAATDSLERLRSVLLRTWGVTTQHAPSKRSSWACSTPFLWLPAIG